MTGYVKSCRRHYGFIVGDDKHEYFVHHTEMRQKLYPGARVIFRATLNGKGYEAKEVKVIEGRMD